MLIDLLNQTLHWQVSGTSPDQASVLCSWARQCTIKFVPSTQEYKQVFAYCPGKIKKGSSQLSSRVAHPARAYYRFCEVKHPLPPGWDASSHAFLQLPLTVHLYLLILLGEERHSVSSDQPHLKPRPLDLHCTVHIFNHNPPTNFLNSNSTSKHQIRRATSWNVRHLHIL